MSVKTTIEWTDATWSPLRAQVREDAADIARAKGYTSLVQIAEKMAGRIGPHCEHVSPGCEHCYSGTNNHRCLRFNGTGLPFDRRSRDLITPIVDEHALLLPLKWRAPRKIFVENQSDLFGEWVPDEHIDRVFEVMALSPQHTFQVLTKRPERMLRVATCFDRDEDFQRVMVLSAWLREKFGQDRDRLAPMLCKPLSNVWLGVSVEDRARKDRIELLRQTPAAARFLSIEPLLEDIGDLDLRGIDWVICGGESGRGARPMRPEWVIDVRDQCVAAGVPFFFKQWGDWIHCAHHLDEHGLCSRPGTMVRGTDQCGYYCDESVGHVDHRECLMHRVGKKRAGRLLDGREWNEFPTPNKTEAR